jgi:hypothetical protein
LIRYSPDEPIFVNVSLAIWLRAAIRTRGWP